MWLRFSRGTSLDRVWPSPSCSGSGAVRGPDAGVARLPSCRARSYYCPMSMGAGAGRLRELLEGLARNRVETGRDHLVMPDELATVPLVHAGHDRNLDAILGGGILRCRAEMGLGPLAPETRAGWESAAYAAAGMLYPTTNVAFLFGSHCEGANARALPWDSGWLLNAQPDLFGLLVEMHELPAPEWRAYFVEYVGSHFGCARDYLDGRPHLWRDRDGVLEDTEARSRNFEVRFPGGLPLAPGLLLVAAPYGPLGPALKIEGALARLRAKGVEIIRYTNIGTDRLRPRIRQWIQAHIEKA